MIDQYLNQTAVWKPAVINEYGEATTFISEPPFTTAQTITVRWEAKRRIVRNRQGQEVVSEARVFCMEAVQPGDVIEYGGRDWPVIAVSEVPGLNGIVRHREVAV
ncbi:MAG: hypothetical protein C4570_06415 [Ammonifex sp.]|nr:MAG: hypothetical protein C4570_06415 [Ammonifex sp.]